MSIDFRCGNCGKVLRVKDEMAGHAGKCPACGLSVTVPSAPPFSQPEPEHEVLAASTEDPDSQPSTPQPEPTAPTEDSDAQEGPVGPPDAPPSDCSPEGVSSLGKASVLSWLIAAVIAAACVATALLVPFAGVVISLVCIAAGATYLVLGRARRKLDGLWGEICAGAKPPAVSLLVVCGGALLLSLWFSVGPGSPTGIGKVIADPEAYAGRTLSSLVIMEHPEAFRQVGAIKAMPLFLMASPELEDKATRILNSIGEHRRIHIRSATRR